MSAWWYFIPAAVQGISAISQASAASRQNENQLAINRYNAQMAYGTAQQNIASQMAIAGMNFGLASKAANFNMKVAEFNTELSTRATEFNNELIRKSILYNGAMVEQTTRYNNLLLDEEQEDIWEAADLDITLMRNQRARERGEIIAIQADSGTVIGQGSNADVIIDQKTQEALDAFVVRHNADRQAAQIEREKARNIWQGRVELQNMMWEGQLQIAKNEYDNTLGNMSIMANAMIGSMNQMSQAAASYGSAAIGALAQKASAESAYQAGMYNSAMQYNQNKIGIRSSMMTGLYGAIGTGISTYYMTKPTVVNQPQTTQYSSRPGGGYTTEGYSYVRGPTIGDPGGSLIGLSSR